MNTLWRISLLLTVFHMVDCFIENRIVGELGSFYNLWTFYNLERKPRYEVKPNQKHKIEPNPKPNPTLSTVTISRHPTSGLSGERPFPRHHHREDVWREYIRKG